MSTQRTIAETALRISVAAPQPWDPKRFVHWNRKAHRSGAGLEPIKTLTHLPFSQVGTPNASLREILKCPVI